MKILLIFLIFLLICLLLPFLSFILVSTSPFIFTYLIVRLFKKPVETQIKKQNSFFDFVIEHVKETKKKQ